MYGAEVWFTMCVCFRKLFFITFFCHEFLLYWNLEDNNANLLTFLEISILWYKVHVQIIDVCYSYRGATQLYNIGT
jgi:hypothetical protein